MLKCLELLVPVGVDFVRFFQYLVLLQVGLGELGVHRSDFGVIMIR